ncbi:MAG TPA: hypothetical protein PLN93_05235 [Vicinamibacterales bacterium]|nr:hypothetical protein [Vicinamibacterales bacterium]HOG28515.1 hypothetical protein [Vicinamibacterales bacterium]HOQ59385.1 hypothetical protein [Vicinamibacterales bacterium]HPK71323.1 hypothetical protein [Vicinamibacterales bacterium]HPW19477.1 hypothetical protein [Vicinamibacterales bacterium]
MRRPLDWRRESEPAGTAATTGAAATALRRRLRFALPAAGGGR